jgi:hypothetical protein
MGSLQSAPMVPPSPARLYASLLGAVLFVAGIVGFFHDLSWLNYLYLAAGAIGLLAAAVAPRPYALCAGLAFTGLAVIEFSSRGWPHLAVGLLGFAAFGASRGSKSTHDVEGEPGKRARPLKPRAQTAAKGS